MKKYRLVTEDGTQVGILYDTHRACEMAWDDYNGIWEDDDGNEHRIGIEEIEINSMCENCKCLNNSCNGTTEKVWTGCIYRKTA